MTPSTSPEELSFGAKLGSILDETKESYSDASLTQKSTLGATALALAFEWATGNEALLGVVGGTVLDATHNALLTASVTSATSFTEQFLFGSLMAASIKNFPRPVKKTQELFYAETMDAENLKAEKHVVVGSGRLRDRWNSAFVLGTSVVMLADNAQQPKSHGENLRNNSGNAGLIGGSVAAIAVSAALATNLGRNAGGGWETASEVFVDIIKNPLTYVGLFAGRIGLNKLHKNRATKKQ